MDKNKKLTAKDATIEKLFLLVREWANEKGIYKNGDLKTQTLKLVEEVGELANGVIKENHFETQDAIGDCMVVLINIAELHWKQIVENNDSGSYSYKTSQSGKITAEYCLENVYEVISKRTGAMKNGSFVKDN